MARLTSPYHSVDGHVYHVYSDCSVGDNIERDKFRWGTGGRKLCDRCRRIRNGEVSR